MTGERWGGYAAFVLIAFDELLAVASSLPFRESRACLKAKIC